MYHVSRTIQWNLHFSKKPRERTSLEKSVGSKNSDSTVYVFPILVIWSVFNSVKEAKYNTVGALYMKGNQDTPLSEII